MVSESLEKLLKDAEYWHNVYTEQAERSGIQNKQMLNYTEGILEGVKMSIRVVELDDNEQAS